MSCINNKILNNIMSRNLFNIRSSNISTVAASTDSIGVSSGLGSISSQNYDNILITGGKITNVYLSNIKSLLLSDTNPTPIGIELKNYLNNSNKWGIKTNNFKLYIRNEDNVINYSPSITFDSNTKGIGINNINPVGTLHIMSANQNIPSLFIDESNSTKNPSILLANSTQTWTISTDYTNNLFYIKNNLLDNSITINYTNHIGINTNIAGSNLSVNGNVSIGSVYSQNKAPDNGLIIQGKVGVGSQDPLNAIDINGSMVIGSHYAGNITAPSNGLLVEGTIGIGITSSIVPIIAPYMLYVSGNSYIDGNLTIQGTTTVINTTQQSSSNLIVKNYGQVPAVSITQYGPYDIFNAHNTYGTQFRISSNGNVSINSSLNVSGSSTFNNATILSNLNVSGSSTFNNATILSTLNVSGSSTFNNATILSNLNVSGESSFNNATILSNLNVLGNATILSNLNVSGTSTFNNATILSNLNVSGNSTFNNVTILSNLNVSDNSTFNNATILSNLNVSGNSSFNGNIILNKLTLPILSMVTSGTTFITSSSNCAQIPLTVDIANNTYFSFFMRTPLATLNSFVLSHAQHPNVISSVSLDSTTTTSQFCFHAKNISSITMSTPFNINYYIFTT